MDVAAVRHRLYADFMMPSRLAAYGDLLQRALEAGYRAVSIETLLFSISTFCAVFNSCKSSRSALMGQFR